MGCVAAKPIEDFHHLDTALDQVKTGDIVLFSGAGALSDIIRGTSPNGDRWSHIGIVIRVSSSSKPMLLESTKELDPIDIISRTNKSGAKLVDLEQKIRGYGGYAIAYRRLHIHEEQKGLRSKWTRTLLKLAHEINDSDYEGNITELMGSLWRSNREEDTDTFFCVELVAHALKQIGVLNNKRLSNNYQLFDFTAEGRLYLNKGYSFGRERYIT